MTYDMSIPSEVFDEYLYCVVMGNKTSRRKIFQACKEGDMKTLDKILEAGVPITYTDDEVEGASLLHLAVLSDSEAVIGLLLDRGVNPSCTDNRKKFPIHWAVIRRKYKAMNALLDRNPECVDAVDRRNRTALHVAAMKGECDAVRIFVQKNSSLTAVDTYGASPLHCAAVRGHCDAAKVLLSGGSDVNAAMKGGQTPLHLASAGGFDYLVHVLIENGAKVDIPDDSGNSPLHSAARAGHISVVHMLLKFSADVMFLNGRGETVEEVSVDSVVVEVVKRAKTEREKRERDLEMIRRLKRDFDATSEKLVDMGFEKEKVDELMSRERSFIIHNYSRIGGVDLYRLVDILSPTVVVTPHEEDNTSRTRDTTEDVGSRVRERVTASGGGLSVSGSSDVHNASSGSISDVSSDDSTIRGLFDEVERMKDERLCRVCMIRPRDTVLYPCRHFACCTYCSIVLKKCPICRARLTRIEKIYSP